MAGREDFIAMLLPAAIQASQRTGVDPRIIVAQAAQETGWGRSAPGNNYFGIKSHGKGGGQTFTTHEVINGQRVKINDSFRQFASPADSVMGYADFITQNKRYAPMRQAQGLDAQLQALGRSGYATDPNYAQSVGAIARSIPLDGGIPASPPGKLGGDSMVARDFDPQVAAQTNTPGSPPSFPFGFPGSQQSPIPPSVADYANDDKEKKSPLSTIAAALSAVPNAPAPNLGGGGDANASGNLLNKALSNPTIASILMDKRIGGLLRG